MTLLARDLQHRRNRDWVRRWNQAHPIPCSRPQPVVNLGQLTVRPRSSAGADAPDSAPVGTTRWDWS